MNVMGNCRKELIFNIEVFFGVAKILVYALPLHVTSLKEKNFITTKIFDLKIFNGHVFWCKRRPCKYGTTV